mgnify:CR=1 FL=1
MQTNIQIITIEKGFTVNYAWLTDDPPKNRFMNIKVSLWIFQDNAFIKKDP